MGQIKETVPVKLFIGGLFRLPSLFEEICEILVQNYGPIDKKTEIWEFPYTKYYEKEMGSNLQRKFISFNNLIPPETLKDIKIHTNEIEGEVARCQSSQEVIKRPINLDPGYLSLSKVILATTKDYSHRLYIGKGIFAEVTLHYQQKQFHPWQWTYPDYQTPHYLAFFDELRALYKKQLRESQMEN